MTGDTSFCAEFSETLNFRVDRSVSDSINKLKIQERVMPVYPHIYTQRSRDFISANVMTFVSFSIRMIQFILIVKEKENPGRITTVDSW